MNKDLGLFASGIFFLGLGEWKNHKWISWIKEANVYTGEPALMKKKVREPDLIGYIFILIGISLILGGLYNVFFLKS
ncbi:MAG: hypothetical protein SCH39_13355 [Methanosarcinales archaeon]|nr:hypothetical protein [Methanosarcinales archaeon]